MSQNPYNPYEQNPPDPNAAPGTSYGSPPPPAQGQGQSPYYGPYTPGSAAPDQNPNYVSYNSPYTPNPPTPGPGVNPGYNPYDQYAPTIGAQGTAPDHSSYAPPPPPLPPTQPRSRGISGKVILLGALALILIIGGIAFGLMSY